MRNILIQLRIEEKAFAKTHLAEALGISYSTLRKWFESGKIQSTSKFNKFTGEQIENIFEQLQFKPMICFDSKEKMEKWNELINSDLVFEDEAIFLSSPYANKKNKMTRMIQKDGIWNAQGLNNHEHLDDYIKNPILQAIMAKKIIGIWIEKLCQLRPKMKIIIYWNGKVNSTICMYAMNDNINEEFLKRYDKYLGIKKCIVREITTRAGSVWGGYEKAVK